MTPVTITHEEAVASQLEQQAIHDVQHPVALTPRLDIARAAQTRIYTIRNVDREIIRTLDELDDTRRALKAHTLRYINGGLPGSNEKQREAALAEALDDDAKYQELLTQEREFHRKQRQLDADRDCLRRMHHLELALIQGEAVTP